MLAALNNAGDVDVYVGEERRTTITTNFGTATEALAAAVLRAGDPTETIHHFFACGMQAPSPQVICLEEIRAVGMRVRGLFSEG